MNFRSMLVAMAMCTSATTVQAAVIFDNQNGFGITNHPAGPPVPTTFTLAASTFIDLIDIYHFGDVLTATTVGIKNSSDVVIGTWAATVADLGSAFRHFLADTDILLGPGTYTITDSRAELWSYNATSGDRGFATVFSGIPPQGVPEPASLALLALGVAGLGFSRRRKRG